MLIKNFKQLSKEDVKIAGGKGASLGELTQIGIPVPEGFVVLSSAFIDFINNKGIKANIDSILKKVKVEDINSVNNASEKIHSIIMNAEVGNKTRKKILGEFDRLNCKFVAVRSSATSEDSADAAWAGQLDTFLNTTKKNLIKNVKNCWASLFTPRAIFYRFEKGLHKIEVSVAVVVQQMIQSEISGIAFSVHPVTEDSNQILIEAGLGLGEAVVSGSITPDSYVIKKDNLEIEEIDVNEQSKKLINKKGENVWVSLKKEGKERFLDENKLKKLGNLIIKIENHYGFPCDIEWAYEKEKIYITQSRPITTLSKKSKKIIIKDEHKRVVTRDYPLILLQIENKAESEGFRSISDGEMFHKVVLIYEKNKGTGFYYNYSKSRENPEVLVKYLNKHKKKFDRLVKEYNPNRKRLLHLCSVPDVKDFAEIYGLAIKIGTSLGIFTLVGRPNSKGIDSKLVKQGLKVRETTDQTLYLVGKTLVGLIEKKVPIKYKKHSKFLTFEEVSKKKLPAVNELEKRKKGFIFYNNQLHPFDKKKFARGHNIWFNEEKESNKTIRGQVGFVGKVKGIVKIVFEEEKLKEIKKGDILVSPMTTPNFLPAIKKAKAIITDEGGITCHAVIVSRELKIPCIVGTGNATRVLKDGDLIEVDAEKGLVKILKK